MKTDTKAFGVSDISPVCLLRTLLRNLWMVVAAALTVSMCASLYAEHFYQPEYTASMTYVVTTKKASYYPGTSLL